MVKRLIALAIIIGAAWWYWTGPYRQSLEPDSPAQLKQNAEDMRLCLRGAAYGPGATGQGGGNEEAQCSEQLGLYEVEGVWYRKKGGAD